MWSSEVTWEKMPKTTETVMHNFPSKGVKWEAKQLTLTLWLEAYVITSHLGGQCVLFAITYKGVLKLSTRLFGKHAFFFYIIMGRTFSDMRNLQTHHQSRKLKISQWEVATDIKAQFTM